MMMRDARLVDIGYKGQHYTWCNNQEGSNQIKERLDRVTGNVTWICKFPRLEVIHKLNIGSNHCPVVMNLEAPKQKSRNVWSGNIREVARGRIHVRFRVHNQVN